jgi:very-short-patch-repair endonuclease
MERSEEQGEPFIIKNLENIQGDERDFVLISLTYGPGPNKTVVDQRFGPINKAQGHRRLNVLFSRARRRIGLFTSMNSRDVRPAQTSKEGVRVLRAYLECAERAGTAGGKLSGRGHDSPFEREVADRLTEWGFDVDVQVGVSQFRIDLAVRHRKNASIYVVGIECDGAAYHSTRSARDRDRLREEVLTSLGWKIIRVWSTDWFADPNGQTLRLVTEIERLEAQEVRPFEDVLFGRGSIFVDRPEQADQPATPIEQPVHAPAPAVERPPEAPAAAAAHAHVAPAASPPLEPRKIVGAAPPGAALLSEDRPLSKDEARLALEAFRKNVIEVELPEAVPHRSILRESMIECFLGARFDDPDDWLSRIPMY